MSLDMSPFTKALLAIVASTWLIGTGAGWSADIQGTILSNGSSVGHALQVGLWRRNPDTLIYDQVEETSSDATTGAYAFIGLADGSYHVRVVDTTGHYAAEIYENAYREAEATAVVIVDGVTQINPVNIEVEVGATISGRVQAPDGSALEGITVGIAEVTDVESMELTDGVFGVGTDASGEFTVGLRPGVYTVAFWDYSDDPLWATQLFSNTVIHERATPIVLTTIGQNFTGVNATMQYGYNISGQVTNPDGHALAGVFASFDAYDAQNDEWGTTVSKRTGPDGFYSVNFSPGTYRVKFEEDSLLFEEEYWNSAAEPSSSTPIVVTSANITGINAELEYSPLARWAISYGLDPFANVEDWLNEDPDSDGYDNFHEFAFGTDPTDPASGNPIIIGPVASSTVTFSAFFHQNVSTAYWLEYEVCETSSLLSNWSCFHVTPSPVPTSAPLSYERLDLTVPAGAAPFLSQFLKLKATIHPN